MYDPTETHSTAEHFSPWDLLPQSEPRTIDPPPGYFYNNVAKHLIKDTVRIMSNGMHIDLDRVEELEAVLDTQLATVATELASNPLVSAFQELQYKRAVSDYIEDRQSKLRSVDYYLKPFNHKDLVHRSYFMHLFATSQGIPHPSELLPGTTVGKWPANLVKTFAKTRPLLQRLLDGTLTSHPLIDQAMQQIATDKAAIYNEKYLAQIRKPEVELPPFNPNSSLQMQGLFEHLDLKSDKLSKKTGLPSYARDVIEEFNKTTVDDDVRHLTQQIIDFSFASIVRTNFIEAFYRYTVDDRLYGSIKLFGAKTFRPTSQNPNLLNMPSTKSIFAGPIKRCFTAAPGKLIYQIDYSALEDKVFANLTKDTNKIITQTDTELDGHLFHATIYFRSKFVDMFGDLPHRDLTIAASRALEDGDKEVKKLRQISKNITFGASYGAFPKKIASQIKCPLEEAEQIFNAYHNDMYPGITQYREEYVIPTAMANGKIHMGMGCYIATDDPERDQRTLHNSTAQFWSILTLLAVNKLHQAIDDAGLQNDIKVISTIYDAIYVEVTQDANIVKWLNDTLVPIMLQDFIPDQIVHNDAEGEIGYDWYQTVKLPHNAPLDEIIQLMESLNE